jgi:hypothetical protein
VCSYPRVTWAQTEADCDGGFLTFHDCVELRTLKTGETLTRNQRNNLRKRLATTARTIVQVHKFALLRALLPVVSSQRRNPCSRLQVF